MWVTALCMCAHVCVLHYVMTVLAQMAAVRLKCKCVT